MTDEFEPVYAIGDIHGHLDALRHVHHLIAQDGGAGARVVHLGDLIDRGPDSRGVIDYLIEGQAQGRDWQVIKGNHDNKLPRFIEDPAWIDPGSTSGLTWTGDERNGAEATFASYGIAGALEMPLAELHRRAVRAIPRAHIEWLDRLRPWLLHPGGFLFVHAGVRPGVDLSSQSPTDLMWIRKPFLDSTQDHGALVVHGHTALRRAALYPNRLNLDSGAGYGRPASVARLDAGGVWLLGADGPQPMTAERAG